MYSFALWLCIVLSIGFGTAADVPFVFDERSSDVANFNSDQIDQVRIASPDLAGVPTVTQATDDQVIAFPVTGGGNAPEGTTEKQVGELKKKLDSAVEPDNSRVHEEAVVLALKYPGDFTINQIDSIYDYLKNGDSSRKGWGYVRDPRGIDYFNYANASLKLGDRANCVGGGDCDDFAILMSALVESIGGTTRIILARNNSTGGHAYAEVYLGRLNDTNNQVVSNVDWLKEKFNTDKIYTHIDTDTKDVWLNMDWGVDEKGNAHPGGPFYQGDLHIVLCIRDRYKKTALSPPATFQQDDTTEKSSESIANELPVEESIEDSKDDNAIDSAGAFCIQRGNIYKNGICTFPGGTSCDAWDFYRGDCILTGKRR
jgi:putative hemolysin